MVNVQYTVLFKVYGLSFDICMYSESNTTVKILNISIISKSLCALR